MVHELGHALGFFGHTSNQNDIMYFVTYARDSYELTDRELENLILVYAEEKCAWTCPL